MKTAQRIAMRAKAKNRWSHDTLTDDEPEEYRDWHDSWVNTKPLKTWTPSPEETAELKAYLAAHPELPF